MFSLSFLVGAQTCFEQRQKDGKNGIEVPKVPSCLESPNLLPHPSCVSTDCRSGQCKRKRKKKD